MEIERSSPLSSSFLNAFRAFKLSLVIDSLAAIDVFKKRKLLLRVLSSGGSIEGIKVMFVLSGDHRDAGKLH